MSLLRRHLLASVTKEEVKKQDVELEDVALEDVALEDVELEDVELEDEELEDVEPEDTEPEDTEPEDAEPEDVGLEDVGLVASPLTNGQPRWIWIDCLSYEGGLTNTGVPYRILRSWVVSVVEDLEGVAETERCTILPRIVVV